MEINDWPVYINDNGVVCCYKDDCHDEWGDEFNFSRIGRRTNWGAMKELLIRHAREDHNIVLRDTRNAS